MPALRGGDSDHDLPWVSTLCGACRDVCPVKIDLPGHLLKLRGRGVQEGRRSKREAAAWRFWGRAMRSPRRYRWFAAVARRFRGVALFLGFGQAWTARREAPEPVARSFRDAWRRDGGA